MEVKVDDNVIKRCVNRRFYNLAQLLVLLTNLPAVLPQMMVRDVFKLSVKAVTALTDNLNTFKYAALLKEKTLSYLSEDVN